MWAISTNRAGQGHVALVAAGLVLLVCVSASAAREATGMVCEVPEKAGFTFGGVIGDRVQVNIDNWLLKAPAANPGILEMFRIRDRKPEPELVPWAGEFIGKYLISAIQACRMTGDERLKPFISDVVAELISTQAQDGYLGPFRENERLLGHWDLWGHYHAMLALLMWHEDTGDEAALDCACKVADLVCNTFLDTGRKIHDAGSHEMNMAIIHGLGRLYRHTSEERYLRMMEQIVQEWELPPAGDYLRTGLDGVEFWRTPKPRWESLHDLQGLTELYQIHAEAGEPEKAEPFREAFAQHWTSIRNRDRHPSGGFTTGEQAVGNPYATGAIETCCTTAWMAMCVDMLRLTGDPSAADELELATWNSMLGSQHPSGRWWTYDTPMDGVRAASAHTIVFQSRFGTPELNCCSVNAPRGLGMLSEWAVMVTGEGATVNYYGPCSINLELSDGTPLTLTQETEYPVGGSVRISVGLQQPVETVLAFRVPSWSRESEVTVNGEVIEGARPGEYVPVTRRWQDGDVVELSFDMGLRYWTGELAREGMACIYRGPLLLALDQKFNTCDTPDVPRLDLSKLDAVPVQADARFKPLILLRMSAANGDEINLCDFATAGAHGTNYRTWLPAINGAPAPFYLQTPAHRAALPAGPALFEWTGYRPSAQTGRTFILEIARDAEFADIVARREGIESTRAIVEIPEGLIQDSELFWRVTARNANGTTANALGSRSFTVDTDLENTTGPDLAEVTLGPNQLVVASSLDGGGEPSFGALTVAENVAPATDRLGREAMAVQLNGRSSKIKYAIVEFPCDEYSACAWVCPEGLPIDRNQQVFSAWAAGMDDPLRIVIVGDQVFARIEAGSFHGTAGVPLANGEWVHVAAVKQGGKLSLYVNGELRETTDAPELVFSAALDVAVGTNPNYSGNECLQGRLDDFAFYAKALTADEVARIYETGGL